MLQAPCETQVNGEKAKEERRKGGKGKGKLMYYVLLGTWN
jgi:hypothetical protein